MNERINEIAKQATVFRGGMQVVELEKFAELIVKECADVAHTHTPQTEECEYQWLIHNKIKEHFGVEE
jgi:hypothetical protein